MGSLIPECKSTSNFGEDTKFAIILAVLGFVFGVIIAVLVMIVGGIGAVFGSSGAESLIGRAWVVIALSLIGALASVVRHKRYGSLILILCGTFIIILLSGGGVIPGILFIIAGYLIFREVGFDLHYFIDYKTDVLKKGIFSLVIILCIIMTFSSFGISDSSRTVKSSTPQMAIPEGAHPQDLLTPEPSSNMAFDFSGVTHATVTTMNKNWDASAADDGFVVYPDLLDANDQTVKWSGTTLPVKIEVWSKKYDNSYKEVKDVLLYSGSGTISSWRDGNFLLGNGIRVPFNQISAPADKKYGMIIASITLPDGRVVEAMNTYTSLSA